MEFSVSCLYWPCAFTAARFLDGPVYEPSSRLYFYSYSFACVCLVYLSSFVIDSNVLGGHPEMAAS